MEQTNWKKKKTIYFLFHAYVMNRRSFELRTCSCLHFNGTFNSNNNNNNDNKYKGHDTEGDGTNV